MAKFGAVALGSLARRPITVEDPRAGEMSLHVRYLDDADDDVIEQGAEAFAVARGAKIPEQSKPLPSGAAQNPWRGNAHYERGFVLHTLLRSCTDPESSEDHPEPFFLTIEQVQKLHPDTIGQIYQRQRMFQSELSPSISEIAGKDILAHIVEICISEDERPFARLAPNLQWILCRIMAVLLIASQGTKWLSSWDSAKKQIESLRLRIVEAVGTGEPIEQIEVTPTAKSKAQAAAAAARRTLSKNKQKAKRRGRQ
jgi:hypothetical protein